MILINLLPHREAARKRRKDAFNVTMGLSALAGGLVAGCIFLWFQSQISDQQNQNNILSAEISKFDVQIKSIAGLEAELKGLQARQKAVEDLQSDRNMPVRLLTELVQQLPEGVYIKNLRQEGQKVTLQGVAQSNERVSELLRNLGTKATWLTRPRLIEIVAGSVSLSPLRDQRRVADFKVEVSLVRPGEVGNAKPAAVPASAPIKPVSAASALSQQPVVPASAPIQQPASAAK